MRLIDADRLLSDLKEENALPICIQNLTKKNKQVIRFENMIYAQPTAYDLDKVLKQLTDESEKCSICELPTCKEDESHCCYCDGLNKAIEIVKAVSMNNNSKNTRKNG